MPMNEEVRDAVNYINSSGFKGAPTYESSWQTIRAELTRLTEIAESVEPLVVRLGEVTTKLEAANAEIARLESAWHVETLNKKDRLIALQEAENDRVKSRLEAALAYDLAAKQFHGEFACLNFPPTDQRTPEQAE